MCVCEYSSTCVPFGSSSATAQRSKGSARAQVYRAARERREAREGDDANQVCQANAAVMCPLVSYALRGPSAFSLGPIFRSGVRPLVERAQRTLQLRASHRSESLGAWPWARRDVQFVALAVHALAPCGSVDGPYN
jgi:hypothetical protein